VPEGTRFNRLNQPARIEDRGSKTILRSSTLNPQSSILDPPPTFMLEQGDLSSVAVEWDKPEYWDEQSLDRELRRQYDVCNSSGLCFNLCPGFPKLFESFDADEADSDPDKLTKDQVWEFVDLCYNCKLCFIKCPYTPPHKFLIDIPKLVMRARAVEARND